jgi:hypothetical protein
MYGQNAVKTASSFILDVVCMSSMMMYSKKLIHVHHVQYSLKREQVFMEWMNEVEKRVRMMHEGGGGGG